MSSAHVTAPVSASVSDSHLVFGDFLESLRLHGFTIGVGHHLRLQKLLSRVGPECQPHELKTLLCPIFATDEREQTRFYEEFDEFFDFEFPNVEPGSDAVITPNTEVVREVTRHQSPSGSKRKWVVLFVGLVLLGMFLASPLMFQGPVNDFPTPTPTPEDVASPTPTPTPFTTFLFNSLEIEVSTLIRILVALLPLLLFLLYELFRRLRRRQRRQQLNDREQPGIPIGFKTSLADVYDADSITRLARLLRTRQRSGTLQLDIGASIAATVKALGFFTLREKATSQPPEYLVLIDRAAFRDHQARLFYELARKLYEESVFLTCYFFEGDPRVSFMSPFVSVSSTPVVRTAEAQQKLEEEARRAQRGVSIEDLHDLYPGHRLIVFGEGEDLVDPVTLQTVDWIKSFAHWQERAILTPRPRSLWDAHEFALRQQFVVMPATLTGLELVAESFAIREPVSIPENLRGDKSSPPPPHSIDSVEGLRELRQYLGEQTFQWLCACAVHPQLQWDLTICLGLQFSTKENLLTEENLLRLFSLPWFRVGVIPDAVREKLMRELSAASEGKVRHTIAELMERAAAAESLAEGPEVVRVPLPQDVETSVPEEFFKRIRNVRDVAFKRFLQPKPFVQFLKRVLPDGLQRLLLTPFGMRLGTRVALALLVSLILWAAFPTIASAFDFSAASTNTNTNTNVNVNINYNANENYNTNYNTNVNLNSNQFPSPSPSVSPRIRPSPSPRATVAPSPIPSVAPSPRPTVSPQAGITGFSVDRSTIRQGERVTLRYAFRNATDIVIVPQDGDLEALNQRFAAITNRVQDQSGTVVVQPQKTTTYVITADIHVGFDQSIQRQRREVTVTVLDNPTSAPQLGPCTPETFNLSRFNHSGDTIEVSINRSCYSDRSVPSSDRWSMSITHSSKSTPARTYNYTANPGEYNAMRKLAAGGLTSAAGEAIINDVLPALRKGDSQEVSAAIQRMLRTVN